MRYIYTKPKEERPYFFPHIKRIVQIHQLGIKLNAFLNYVRYTCSKGKYKKYLAKGRSL